jgi:hypothetical protein
MKPATYGLQYIWSRLQGHHFVQQLIYCITYSAVATNSSLLAITIYSSVATLMYTDTKYSVPFTAYESLNVLHDSIVL